MTDATTASAQPMATQRNSPWTSAKGPTSELPVLHHLKVSHYNEKARWALDYKRVPHVRKGALAGTQKTVAKKLSGRTTLPILLLDGQVFGDSTDIIAALEEAYPEPTLYPQDPAERRRALELEDFFDEELGPHIRLLGMHYTLPDGKLMLGTFAPDLRGAQLKAALATFPLIRRRLISDYGISDQTVALARDKVRAAADRFHAELQPSGYLVGETFTVADLTLAALLSPAANPEQFPYPQPARHHERGQALRDFIDVPDLLDWARLIYARHRPASAEVTTNVR